MAGDIQGSTEINKVIYGNEVLIDLTMDTATQQNVLRGIEFHQSNGFKQTGLLDSGKKFQIGSFTLATATQTYTVEHSLGAEPTVIAYFTNSGVASNYNKAGAYIKQIVDENGSLGSSHIDALVCGSGYTTELTWGNSVSYRSFAIQEITATYFTIGYNRNYSSKTGCAAGVKYIWIAIL